MIFVVDATVATLVGVQTPEHTARLCVHEDRRCACQLRREPVLEQLPADEQALRRGRLRVVRMR